MTPEEQLQARDERDRRDRYICAVLSGMSTRGLIDRPQSITEAVAFSVRVADAALAAADGE